MSESNPQLQKRSPELKWIGPAGAPSTSSLSWYEPVSGGDGGDGAQNGDQSLERRLDEILIEPEVSASARFCANELNSPL